MAVNIDWGDRIINVPKADMTLVQSVPTEIRQLNLNTFRLTLKSLEDDEEGMPFPDTHSHNTEVTVGGITLARVIEIINDYTITFEDGQYAVNLVGANSNVGDRINLNQVSVRSANSAGLIAIPEIEYASFESGVWVDVTSDNTGSLYPVGTPAYPSNNLTSVKEIADFRGFRRVFVVGDLILNQGLDYSGYEFIGTSHVQSTLTIETAADVTNCVFKDLRVTGTLDGENELTNCIVEDVTYVSGHIHSSGLVGTLTLAGNTPSLLSDCRTIDPYDAPIIDMGESGQDLAMPNYSGTVTIKNLSGANYCGIGLLGGKVVLADTVTAGTIHCAGIGDLSDSVGEHIQSGSWNGATIINGTIYAEDIEEIRKMTSNKVTKSGDVITIYDNDDTTVWKTFDLANEGRVEV
ncbi:MAG: hypothetical protein ACTSWQ_00835 [Candidatus Thorarchaeota archaeon]